MELRKHAYLIRNLPFLHAEKCTRENVKRHIEDCVFQPVTAWLRAFMDAEMTVVDSFHGAVFSIIFNRPFWVISNSKQSLALLKQGLA